MKMIIIKYCIDCQNQMAYLKKDGKVGVYCNLKGKDIKSEWKIPGWCPLDDYPSTNN